MTNISFTLEELRHLQALVLQECINHHNGKAVSREEHAHHIEVLQVVLLHIAKALELEKGK